VATWIFKVDSDVHAGSSVAPCHPEGLELDDGQRIMPSRAQLWLYDRWRIGWEQAARVRDSYPDGILGGLLNGDLVDGPSHHGHVQQMSLHPGAEKVIAKKLLEIPQGLGVEKWWVVRGTESHVGKNGASEESIAEWLKAEKDTDRGTWSWWHLRLDLDGYRIDATHHGRIGQRPWTKPNVTMNLAAEIFYEHAAEDFRLNRLPTAPHLAIRSHLHRYMDTQAAHPVRVIQTGAYQLATSYVHKVAPGVLADIGGLIVVVRDGELVEVIPCIDKPDRGTAWKAA
jgi:hypothetical protein